MVFIKLEINLFFGFLLNFQKYVEYFDNQIDENSISKLGKTYLVQSMNGNVGANVIEITFSIVFQII